MNVHPIVLLLALVSTMVVIGCSAAPTPIPAPSPSFTAEEVIALVKTWEDANNRGYGRSVFSAFLLSLRPSRCVGDIRIIQNQRYLAHQGTTSEPGPGKYKTRMHILKWTPSSGQR